MVSTWEQEKAMLVEASGIEHRHLRSSNIGAYFTHEATHPDRLGHGAVVLQQLTFCSPELKADDCFEDFQAFRSL